MELATPSLQQSSGLDSPCSPPPPCLLLQALEHPWITAGSVSDSPLTGAVENMKHQLMVIAAE